MTDTVPPWQDITHLTRNLCISERTVDAWVKQGILPPPVLRGGKRLWKWKLVESYLERSGDNVPLSPDDQAESIRNATREAASEGR